MMTTDAREQLRQHLIVDEGLKLRLSGLPRLLDAIDGLRVPGLDLVELGPLFTD